MSKLKPDKINFFNDDFVIEIKDDNFSKKRKKNSYKKFDSKNDTDEVDELKKAIDNANLQADEIIHQANLQADEIISDAKFEAQEEKNKIIDNANLQADEIINTANENSKKEAETLIENSKEEIEKNRIESAKKGYEEGYRDGVEKIREELEDKILSFDNFCKSQYEVKEKIIKSAYKDILDIIENISKKILLKEIDKETLDKIIKKTVSLLEKKENVSIIVSEKYAKLLFELQKNSLNNEIELDFNDFKQYDGFELIHNPKFDDDTIIVQNLKERFDASVASQLDVIIRDILNNSQNGNLEFENIEENETE